jgi:hypothetical protein
MRDGREPKTSKMLQTACKLWSTGLVGLSSAATILIALERGYEGSWYRLSTIMHRPEAANPAFGYRLLFPFLAVQVQKLAPSLTDHNCFIAIQAIIIAVTVYLSGEWAKVFVPKVGRPFGYALVALMVCPTIGYWTFYDVAIIGFWTGCLLLLHHNKPVAYVAIFAIATLNHENSLLLVPCAVLYCWNRMKLSRLTLFAISQIALWAGVRYLVISLVPAGPLFDIRLWENLAFWRHYTLQSLFFGWVILIPWWSVAFMGWKYAPRLLRCSAISLPGLFVVTTLFGKYDEARQFNAFIPTCIGLIGCWYRYKTDGTAIAPALLTADPVHQAS